MTLAELLELLDDSNDDDLFAAADDFRRKTCGDEIHLRGIIEYSNYCRCHCAYCGLNAGNTGLKRYRLDVETVRRATQTAYRRGVRTIVLQGGEDPGLSAGDICRYVEAVKSAGDVAVTLSSGEFSREDYRMMRSAGADRYLLKIETTNREIYRRLHPGASFENRVRCIGDIAGLGFQTGSGSLIGLPGQTVEDIAADIVFCAGLDLDMATFSPFIPHPDTPLSGETSGAWSMGLRTLAAARLALPKVHIPVSTALAAISPNDYLDGLRAGANVVMADLTPHAEAALYDLYPGKVATGNSENRDAVDRLMGLIRKTNRPLGAGRGDSLKRLPAKAAVDTKP